MKLSSFLLFLLPLSGTPLCGADQAHDSTAGQPSEADRNRLLDETRQLLEDSDGLSPDQQLWLEILTDELATRHGVYMVRFGDTYSKIAQRLEIKLADIHRLNPDVDYPRGVFVTQVLRVK